MKIWTSFGSEHSADLVMIGHFSTVADAENVKGLFGKLAEAANAEEEQARIDRGDRGYSDEMLDTLSKLGVHSMGPADPEQFGYSYTLVQRDTMLVLRTEEIDVGAYLKLMVDGGASVEVFSAHDYPERSKDLP